ncbi:MAG TPA: hypothetical protein VEN81_09735 [Planctomycetota bacterium]|nr:hypothetical protein [Planctomycetota bacterium]
MLRAIGVLALVFCRQEADATYTDEEKGFSMTIPAGWSMTRSSEKSRYLLLRAPAGTRSGAMLILAISEPSKGISDGSITLDTYIEEMKKQYPKKFMEFEFVKAEKGKDPDQNPMVDLTYRYTNGGNRIGQLQHVLWTRTQSWSLSWGCLDDGFEKNRELFDRISRTFKPLPKK